MNRYRFASLALSGLLAAFLGFSGGMMIDMSRENEVPADVIVFAALFWVVLMATAFYWLAGVWKGNRR